MGPHDLASAFAPHIFGKGELLQGNVDIRALARVRSISAMRSHAYLPQVSIMEDLIRNAQALFHEYPLPPTPPSSTQAEETASITSYGSVFLSPDVQQHSEVQAMGSFLRPRPVSLIYPSTQSTSSVSPSDSPVDVSSRATPNMVPLLSPLPGFSRSPSSTETKETTTREQVRNKVRSKEAIFLNPSQDVDPPPPHPTASRRLSQQPYSEALALSLNPGAGSQLLDVNITDNPLSFATSLPTAMGAYSPAPEERLR